MEERIKFCDDCREEGKRTEAVERLVGKSGHYLDVCREHLPQQKIRRRRNNMHGPKAKQTQKPKRRRFKCSYCPDRLPTERGLHVHEAIKHGVKRKKEEKQAA